MEITYEWDCRTVEVNYEQEGESNVVYLIHWSLDGVSTELNEEETLTLFQLPVVKKYL